MTTNTVLLSVVLSGLRCVGGAALEFTLNRCSVKAQVSTDLGGAALSAVQRFNLVP